MRNKSRSRRRTGLFSLLLGLLGAGTSGCITPCMYGSPSADYSVKGKVIDENGKPIPGLQVVLAHRYDNTDAVIYDENYLPIDTLQTGTDGIYRLETQTGFPISKLQVDVHDIDGEANGGAFNDAALVIRDIDYSGGDKNWYAGYAEINIPDIILKKK